MILLETVAPGEMTYEAATESNGGIGKVRILLLGIVGVPGLVALLLSELGFGWLAVPGALVVGALVFAYWRWSEKPLPVVLAVRRGRLHVTSGRRQFDIALTDLESVSIDRREIQRIQDGSALVPATMAINTTVGPVGEIVRVSLHGANETFLLTEEYQPYSAGLEGMGKVRVFLRKHGWAPTEERTEETPRKKRRKKASPSSDSTSTS